MNLARPIYSSIGFYFEELGSVEETVMKSDFDRRERKFRRRKSQRANWGNAI